MTRRHCLAPMCVLAILLTCAGVARAADATALAAAKAHYIAGEALYKDGNFQKALHEFLAANELVPYPEFLLNAGQCFRNLGDGVNAIRMYEAYLSLAPAGHPWRPQARKYIAELRAKLAAKEKVEPPAATSPATPAPALASLSVPPPPRPLWKRGWFWPVVGVAIGGTAIALGLGLGLGLQPRAASPNMP